MIKKNKQGFTLIELIVVIAVIAILLLILTPSVTGFIKNAKETEDIANLKILNTLTSSYRVENSESDYFLLSDNSEFLMNLLIPEKLSEEVKPVQEDKKFIWDLDNQFWIIVDKINTTPIEDFSVNNSKPFSLNNYNGLSGTDIYLPEIINEVVITEIGQDAFDGNVDTNIKLTSVVLPDTIVNIKGHAFRNNELEKIDIPDSVENIYFTSFANNNLNEVNFGNSIKTIGQYAFQNNNLTYVSLPDSVTKISANAFANNNITSITIGDNVTVENNAFRFNADSDFDTFYNNNNKKAGTYTYTEKTWFYSE